MLTIRDVTKTRERKPLTRLEMQALAADPNRPTVTRAEYDADRNKYRELLISGELRIVGE